MISSSDSLLSRLSSTSLESGSSLSTTQQQVDQLVQNFSREVTNSRTLAAMIAGGFADRFVRLGVSSFAASAPQWMAPVLRPLGQAASLLAESATFESTQRLLSSQSHPNSFQQGFASTLLTLGGLRLGNYLGHSQNIIVQHLLADVSMVSMHHLSHQWLGTAAPEGSMVEQFLHAEAMSVQMTMGMNLLHYSVPRLRALQHSLDFSLQTQSSVHSHLSESVSMLDPAYAMAGNSSGTKLTQSDPLNLNRPTLMAMVGKSPSEPPSSQEPPSTLRDPRVSGVQPVSTFPSFRRVRRNRAGESYEYELLLSPLNELLAGKTLPVAHRSGQTLFLEYFSKELHDLTDSFFRSGTPSYRLIAREGDSSGTLRVFVEDHALTLYAITTNGQQGRKAMQAGAGSILVEWLAAQAALQGKQFQIYQIENPHVVDILLNHSLMDPYSTLESADWSCFAAHEYRTIETVSFNDREAVLKARDALAERKEVMLLNVRGRPNSNLLRGEAVNDQFSWTNLLENRIAQRIRDLEEAPVKSIFYKEEIGRLTSMSTRDVPSFLQAVESLNILYTRNLIRGGNKGVAWIREVVREISEHIHSNRLFSDLVYQEAGKNIFYVPSNFELPKLVKFGFPDQPSIVYLNDQMALGFGQQAYFRLDRLGTSQEIVSGTKVIR
ncbi:MAG: hypothetical protein JNK65_07315, partial [Deltaproteobacteria bacterium]|nr:hypothetical protein [Deltaproteobacteria bacterium]